jgi:hypothetical protein
MFTLEKKDGFFSTFLMLIGRPFQQVIRPGEILDWKKTPTSNQTAESAIPGPVRLWGCTSSGTDPKKSGTPCTALHTIETTTVSQAEWRKRYGTRDTRQDRTPSQM